MIDLTCLNWRHDSRTRVPEYYTSPPNDTRNRLNTFLAGWNQQLTKPGKVAKSVTWKNLGRAYASVLGSIPVRQRTALYTILLYQYVNSPRTAKWSPAERNLALSYFPPRADDTNGKERLRLADIPPSDADWNTIQRFALTFNAYEFHGSSEKCEQIANARRAETLIELRTCLFFEQRRWRHFGEEPDAEAMHYIRGLLDKIRKAVADAKTIQPSD